MILGFWAIVLSAYVPGLVYLVAVVSAVLTWLTRQEYPDLKWFATFCGLVTLGLCVFSIWAA